MERKRKDRKGEGALGVKESRIREGRGIELRGEKKIIFFFFFKKSRMERGKERGEISCCDLVQLLAVQTAAVWKGIEFI